MNPLWFLFFLFLGSAAYAGISAAPWVPTRKKTRHNLLDQLGLSGDETIFDLGCGDGRVLFDLANRYPHARLVGYEISFLPYLVAKTRSFFYKNVSIQFKSLFKAPVEEADILFLFLLPKPYQKLLPKLQKKLKKDARVIFAAWVLPNHTADQVIQSPKTEGLYVYTAKTLRSAIL